MKATVNEYTNLFDKPSGTGADSRFSLEPNEVVEVLDESATNSRSPGVNACEFSFRKVKKTVAKDQKVVGWVLANHITIEPKAN